MALLSQEKEDLISMRARATSFSVFVSTDEGEVIDALEDELRYHLRVSESTCEIDLEVHGRYAGSQERSRKLVGTRA